MSISYTPAPPGVKTGPLRKRWAVSLWLQFTLQWIWLLPHAFYKMEDGGFFDQGTAEKGMSAIVLTPSRYRLERRGTQQEWEAWADRAIARGIERGLKLAEKHRDWNESGKYRYKYKDTAPTTYIKRRYYRGIGVDGVAALAARRGWDVDWSRTQYDSAVHLVLRQPQGS
ncbi:hypothetical protein [Kitasatospora camelliae]|uniref:Uncharacterized protein n=1 Tax=Kitasatospora camelliae TaxID=3156397 RepID=A0AAU8JU39_9ACTN